MDKIINASIYAIYFIIAIVSIVVSYQVNVVMALIVIALEYTRFIAIYKKVYFVVMLVFILNLALIGYNGKKNQDLIDFNNTQIQTNNNTVKNSNSVITNFIATKDLKAATVKDLKAEIGTVQGLQSLSVDWWLLVIVYFLLETALLGLIVGINKQNKFKITQENKAKKHIKTMDKLNGTKSQVKMQEMVKAVDPTKNTNSLTYVGNYVDYARTKNISRSQSKELFTLWKAEGLLVKQDGKNYLKG